MSLLGEEPWMATEPVAEEAYDEVLIRADSRRAVSGEAVEEGVCRSLTELSPCWTRFPAAPEI